MKATVISNDDLNCERRGKNTLSHERPMFENFYVNYEIRAKGNEFFSEHTSSMIPVFSQPCSKNIHNVSDI